MVLSNFQGIFNVLAQFLSTRGEIHKTQKRATILAQMWLSHKVFLLINPMLTLESASIRRLHYCCNVSSPEDNDYDLHWAA